MGGIIWLNTQDYDQVFLQGRWWEFASGGWRMASCDEHFSFNWESALKTGGRKGNNAVRERLMVAVIPESSYMILSDLYLVHRFLTGICDNALDFSAT